VSTPFLLGVFWFFALGALGTFLPYFSLYLSREVGLSGTEVGLVMGTLPFVGMLSQPAWGLAADRSGRRSRILTVVSCGAACGYLAIVGADGFAATWLATAATAVFSTAVIPTTVAVSLAALSGRGPHAFGRVRVWGTIGFLVSVASFPRLADYLQAASGDSDLGLALRVSAVSLSVAALVSLRLPAEGALAVRARRGQWRELLADRAFRRLLLFVFGAYLCLHGPMSLFPIFVDSIGGDVDEVSRLWLCMLALEIPLMLASGEGLRRLGPRLLVVGGTAAGALRWFVCGLAPPMELLYAVQVLHGVAVTGLLIGAPLYLDVVVPAALRSTGQGMLAMVGVSFGGMLSSLAAGALVDAFGGRAPALVGGAAGLVLVVAGFRLLPAPQARDTARASTAPLSS
jgi:PPP family 3-phenylpropionic acid transporter